MRVQYHPSIASARNYAQVYADQDQYDWIIYCYNNNARSYRIEPAHIQPFTIDKFVARITPKQGGRSNA